MTGQLPFFKMTAETAVVIAVSRGQVPNRKSYPELHEEDPFWPLLNKCWNTEPEERPDMKELYETVSRHSNVPLARTKLFLSSFNGNACSAGTGRPGALFVPRNPPPTKGLNLPKYIHPNTSTSWNIFSFP